MKQAKKPPGPGNPMPLHYYWVQSIHWENDKKHRQRITSQAAQNLRTAGYKISRTLDQHPEHPGKPPPAKKIKPPGF